MKNKVLIGLGIVSLLFCIFYWYEVRPTKIRSYCNWSVRWGPDKEYNSNNKNHPEVYDFLYKSCLRSKGLEK